MKKYRVNVYYYPPKEIGFVEIEADSKEEAISDFNPSDIEWTTDDLISHPDIEVSNVEELKEEK